ncbi:unnamed protein product [Acanthoscelides obtectus]|uniref:Uncharacterized protein n=1 Tax=Acanthoscelides obtectus TaxID=200917 RepID=A0A9P0PCC9_ACAOB|nr:unnamed protein product [Acanthoscelides obtectus]CAK1632425.1 hypothetical protein AOBTE_LOCUS7555 [Acanthoscelides obtectus]
MKKNFFFQFIKASQHVAFGQPAYFCVEQKNFVIRIEILAKIAAQSQAKQNTKAKLQKCNDAVNDNALVLDLVLANFNDVVPRTYRLLKRIIIQLYYSSRGLERT